MPQESTKGERLNPFDHALKRPDMYIGSIKTVKLETDTLKSGEKSVSKETIKYNPGLFHIIREIVSNAIDNKWRSERNGKVMKKFDFEIDINTGTISVTNDGYCIPVKKEEYSYTDYRTGKVTKEVLYPAETFFGEMLAGTNFDDTKERKTSGLNGLGASVCNVFSKKFIVDHSDGSKRFLQTYTENGKKRTTPEITPYKKVGYTKISFTPDYDRFNYKINSKFVDFLRLYCCEVSMITGLPINFIVVEDSSKAEKLTYKDLPKFVKLFHSSKNFLHYITPTGDECVLIEGEENDSDTLNDISNVSFVNGIRTKDGGVHVDAWRDVIIGPLVRAYNSRKKKDLIKTTAKQLYPYLRLFVKVELDKPSFDSQTKDRLNSPKPTPLKPKDEDISKILKWDFVSLLEEKLKFFADRKLEKSEKVKPRVKSKKLTDANEAGRKESAKCTLFITEGDSAKSLAESLASQLPGGADYHGAFALKGKLLNVTGKTVKKIADNDEISQLQAAIGLVPRTDYSKEENRKSLRYGKIVFLTDADDDGFHIRGLLANFFWTRFPQLWDRNFFLIASESTPVVKVFDKPSSDKPSRVFYTNVEYKQWAKTESTGKERIEYIKGLASLKSSDIIEIAGNRCTVDYFLGGDEEEYMSTAFDPKKADARKLWITRDMEGDSIYEDVKFVCKGEQSLSSYMDTNFLVYSRMSLVRALPSVMDGFKESQRKMFYGLNKMGATSRNKHDTVERLSLTCATLSGYHHGGTSAQGAMTKMTQGFVGSNNIPLLVNYGMTGTRRQGGEDAGAPRYAKTYVDPFSSIIFQNSDSPLLHYLEDDGKPVEPAHYIPIIPMFLVNGQIGIATGYSTKTPNYNPLHLADWILAWLDGKTNTIERIKPWWRGFTGDVTLDEKTNKVTVRGKLEKIKSGPKKGWWRITEIPPNMRIDDFKEMVENLTVKSKDKPALLKDVKMYNGDNSVDVYILPTSDFIPDIDTKSNPFSILQCNISMNNMHGIDKNGYPRDYKTPEDLLEYWCPIRLTYYVKRKAHLIKSSEYSYRKALNKYKFIEAVKSGELDMNQEEDVLEEKMLDLGLEKLGEGEKPTFEYLLSMQMRTIMSKTKGEEVKKEADKIKSYIEEIKGKTESDMWKEDLETFKSKYPEWLKSRVEEPKKKK